MGVEKLKVSKTLLSTEVVETANDKLNLLSNVTRTLLFAVQ